MARYRLHWPGIPFRIVSGGSGLMSGEPAEAAPPDLENLPFELPTPELRLRILHQLTIEPHPALLDQAPGLRVARGHPHRLQEPGKPDGASLFPLDPWGNLDHRNVLGEIALPEHSVEAGLGLTGRIGAVVEPDDFRGQAALGQVRPQR